MREIIARAVCVVTVVVVIALSLLFAYEHNPSVQSKVMNETTESSAIVSPAQREPGGRPADKSEQTAPPMSELQLQRGRAVYAEQKCATCHSISGQGNPRNPLDGVASRWDQEELREWITGTGVAADVLAAAIVKRKQRYREIAAEDMDALVRYLAALRSSK